MKRIFEIDSFSLIPKNCLLDLLQRCTVLNCPKGSFLYRSGDSITAIFVVLSGRFITYRLTAEGKQCTVKIITKGGFIGEEDIFSNEVRDTYAESTADSQCLSIPAKDYERLLADFPEFSRMRLKKLSHRLKETEQTMQVIAYGKIKQRLLLILAKIGKEMGINKADGIEFVLNWSHEELASMIGSTRESITHTFSLLQNEGVLVFDKKTLTLSINKAKLNNYL